MSFSYPAAWSLVAAGALSLALPLHATEPEPSDSCIRQFLAHDDRQPPYRATRRLEAENGSRRGWLEAVTEYTPQRGFHYQVTGEGGSDYIRDHVLRAVLDGEREAIAGGELRRSALDGANYTFQFEGLDGDGLATIRLAPRRQERMLIAGQLFVQPEDGQLVRIQGRLAKSPSFWVKDVAIVRSYARINGAIMPVALESNARLRLFGAATLRMTYAYSHIDGHPIPPHTEPDR